MPCPLGACRRRVLPPSGVPVIRALLLGLGLGCAVAAGAGEHQLQVTASAYNSLPGQGQGDVSVGAWGDRLRPGMRAIAVSRDLLDMGLGHRSRVTIDGLPGEYLVLDKMHPRWRKKIDVYHGTDLQAARRWGVRTVTIRWRDAPQNESRR